MDWESERRVELHNCTDLWCRIALQEDTQFIDSESQKTPQISRPSFPKRIQISGSSSAPLQALGISMILGMGWLRLVGSFKL